MLWQINLSYVDLLKEQISLREYDIKDFGYKGPMI